MEDRLNAKIEEVKKEKGPTYSSSLQSEKSLQAKVTTTNRLVKSLAQQKDPKKEEEESKLRKERTLIVKKIHGSES